MSTATAQTLETITGGVTTPRGFKAAGIHAVAAALAA